MRQSACKLRNEETRSKEGGNKSVADWLIVDIPINNLTGLIKNLKIHYIHVKKNGYSRRLLMNLWL